MPDRPSLQELRQVQADFNVFGPLHEASLQAELGRAPDAGPLSGRVVGLKANIAAEDAPWTAGLGAHAARIAQRDAWGVQRLRAAGARVVPGLNMDAAALGGATDNVDFGRTQNPRAPGRSAGGSSGGSAAAVAAGLVDVALGTDTLGSVRIPASYCGVFGLKPTQGLVGRTGIVPLAPSHDVVGPLAAQASDLWPVLTAMAGIDPDDPASRPAPEGWDAAPDTVRAKGLRIGVPDQVASVDCDAEVRAALEQAKTALEDAGAAVGSVDMPGWDPATLRQQAFLITEAEGAVTYAEALETGGVLPPMVEKLLRYGSMLPSAKLVTAWHAVAAARAQLDRTFASVDVLLMPTTPQRAFDAAERPPVNQADFTALANAAGVPALAIPVEVPGETLPASVQLVGPAWSERVLVGLAMRLQEAL